MSECLYSAPGLLAIIREAVWKALLNLSDEDPLASLRFARDEMRKWLVEIELLLGEEEVQDGDDEG
jgi:hypothetical protein